MSEWTPHTYRGPFSSPLWSSPSLMRLWQLARLTQAVSTWQSEQSPLLGSVDLSESGLKDTPSWERRGGGGVQTGGVSAKSRAESRCLAHPLPLLHVQMDRPFSSCRLLVPSSLLSFPTSRTLLSLRAPVVAHPNPAQSQFWVCQFRFLVTSMSTHPSLPLVSLQFPGEGGFLCLRPSLS